MVTFRGSFLDIFKIDLKFFDLSRGGRCVLDHSTRSSNLYVCVIYNSCEIIILSYLILGYRNLNFYTSVL